MMANEEHVRILMQGVEAWNQWRQANTGSVADLRGIDLSGTKLDGFVFSRTDFAGAVLRGAQIDDSAIVGCDLRRADLTECDFHDTVVVRTDFTKACLDRAHLDGMIILRSDFTHARFKEASFGDVVMNGNVIVGNDFSTTVGLANIRHIGPSNIDIDTILASAGNLPDSFLRGAGIPDELVSLLAKLARITKTFYTCFISCSNKTEDFAAQLHRDLSQAGVKCWYAPHDMRIGDRVRTRIGQEIQDHDRLLLVLSEHSVASVWVEDEVELALERERRHGKTVLFPIRLDDAVMEVEIGWPAVVRNTRHIGDFRSWEDQEAYRIAFERLLMDLRAEEE